ncbi:hypothetical protein QZH41_019151, partial [Actinostola sp. cb2023]
MAADRNSIHVVSFSGGTGRKIVNNIDSIVNGALPKEKLCQYFMDPEIAKDTILDYITYCEGRLMYLKDLKKEGKFVRDFGAYQEEISLDDSEVGDYIDGLLNFWNDTKTDIEEKFIQLHDRFKIKKGSKKVKERMYANDISTLAAELVIKFYIKVSKDFKEIVLTLRDDIFGVDEEYLIDIFDVKCKEWGFLLRFLFNNGLGCGDYGHIVIEHGAMLLRVFRSMKVYSKQGLEAAHLLEKIIFSKATSHDGAGYGSSILQLLIHTYATKTLFLRLCFRHAKLCIEEGKHFYFRGCGWRPPKHDLWDAQDKKFVLAIEGLFCNIFGEDFPNYTYEAKQCSVDEPDTIYDHQEWENNFSSIMSTLPNTVGRSNSTGQSSQNLDEEQSNSSTPDTSSSSRGTLDCSDSNPSVLPLYPDIERLWTDNSMTRAELAELVLPPVKAIDTSMVKEIVDPQDLACPWDLDFRPQNSAVESFDKILSDMENNSDDDSCIYAVNLGSY